jgi:hypothetical protein
MVAGNYRRCPFSRVRTCAREGGIGAASLVALVAYLVTTKPGSFLGVAPLLRVETVSADGRRVHILMRLAQPPYNSAVSIWSPPVWTPDGKPSSSRSAKRKPACAYMPETARLQPRH